MSTKRTDYISWDEYFMGIAILSCSRSKDPSTQVGACIVDPEHKVVGIGYNGFPSGISDEYLPWGRDGEKPLDTKYPFVCHAEENAIMNSHTNKLNGCTLYITLFPCNECAKIIIQSGIKHIYYIDDKYANTYNVKAAKHMFDLVGITYKQYFGKILKTKFQYSSNIGTLKEEKYPADINTATMTINEWARLPLTIKMDNPLPDTSHNISVPIKQWALMSNKEKKAYLDNDLDKLIVEREC